MEPKSLLLGSCPFRYYADFKYDVVHINAIKITFIIILKHVLNLIADVLSEGCLNMLLGDFQLFRSGHS
jgi:hypothetical protein